MAGIWEQIGSAVAKNVDINGLADKVWDKIWAWAEPKIDETVDKYTPVVIDKIMAAMPVLVATAVKAATDEVLGKFGHVLDSDPDIPGLSNVFDLSETIRNQINGDQNIPFHIPVLSDIMKGLQR